MRISDWSSDVCSSDLSYDDAILDGRVPLAGDTVVGAGAAQRHALIDRHIVADLGGFADDGKSVVDEEVAADLHPGVNVDGGQKPREVVHHTGQEIQLPPEKPVSDAVKRKRMNPRIKQAFPAGSRRGIARLPRIKIRSEERRVGKEWVRTCRSP